MYDLYQLREWYGEVYVVILPDGRKIPFKPLSIGEYLYYDSQFKESRVPKSILENEIFLKCVQDKSFTIDIHSLNAGLVTSVVSYIMQNSTPSSLEEVDNALNHSRDKANIILYDLVSYVCMAFPAYKPDELLKMKFEDFILIVGIAERKLLASGLVKDPITLFSNKEEQKQMPVQKPVQKVNPLQNMPPPPDANLAKIWSEQKSGQTIIKKADIAEHEAAYTGHEKEDKIINDHKMLDDTVGFYQEYMEQMKNGQKVKIKTPEERKAEALKRAEINKKKLQEDVVKFKKQKELQDKDMAKLMARTRKNKRTAK